MICEYAEMATHGDFIGRWGGGRVQKKILSRFHLGFLGILGQGKFVANVQKV